jgi:peptidyl-tRNA hydrolase, PTH2 family
MLLSPQARQLLVRGVSPMPQKSRVNALSQHLRISLALPFLALTDPQASANMLNPSAAELLERTGPSTLALSFSSLLFGLVAGYFIGTGSSIGLFGRNNPSAPDKRSSKKRTAPKKSWPNSYDVDVQAGSDTSDEEFIKAVHIGGADADDEEDTDENEVDLTDPPAAGRPDDEVKLMLIVRTDLGMTKGKIAAQCGHATLAVYKTLSGGGGAARQALLRRWENGGQPKIAVKCDSEEDLLLLQGQAISLGLVARVIRDAGRTQIQAGSATVLGVLGPKSVVDNVTGVLKLL